MDWKKQLLLFGGPSTPISKEVKCPLEVSFDIVVSDGGIFGQSYSSSVGYAISQGSMMSENRCLLLQNCCIFLLNDASKSLRVFSLKDFHAEILLHTKICLMNVTFYYVQSKPVSQKNSMRQFKMDLRVALIVLLK